MSIWAAAQLSLRFAIESLGSCITNRCLHIVLNGWSGQEVASPEFICVTTSTPTKNDALMFAITGTLLLALTWTPSLFAEIADVHF